MFPALGPRSYWFLSPWFLMKWFINFFQFCCLFFLRKNASNHFRLVTRTSVGTLSCVLCRLEWVTQHVIHWADAICRGTKIYKVPVALEGETNVRFFPVIFFSIHRVVFFFFPFCLVLGEQWVYLVPWPLDALGAGSELTKAEHPYAQASPLASAVR